MNARPAKGPGSAAALRPGDYRRLVQALPDACLVLRPDAPRFTIVEVSAAYERATMTRRAGILGRGLFEVFPDNPDDPQASGVRNLMASLQRVVATGRADAMAVQKYDMRRPEEAGGGFEERWWSLANSPVLDDDGRIACIVHRVEDVTEFVRLKRAGAERERLEAELRGRADEMEAEVFRRAQQIQEVNEQLRRSNEEVSRLYEKTLELDRLKTQFFATVSHELRTPLALILGPTRRLLAAAGTGEDARRELAVIERNANTLLRHVNDLLDASRLEAGRMALGYTRVDLVRLAGFVASHFELLARDNGIRFELELPSQAIVEADGDKLARVLFNLLTNAFKFTPDGGRVRLSVRPGADRLRIEVADSGPGIPAAQRGAVFERFRQLETGTRRHFGGTGLGLAIAHDIVALHGGTIEAGAAPEGGALLAIELPARAPAGSAVEAERSPAALPEEWREEVDALRGRAVPAPARAATDGALVLVVENHPEMSRFVAEALAPAYRVVTAADGRQGLDQALALHPDLVLTDIMMPALGGDELVRELRARAEFDDMPIVVLTARADDALRTRLLREGAQDYLVKPFAGEELRARVGGLLAVRRTAQALRRSEEQWRELFAQASDGIFIADLGGRYTDVNRAGCELLGYARDEIVGKTIVDLIDASEVPRLWQEREAMLGGMPTVREWALRRKDGHMLPVEVSARILSDGRWLGVVRDASERRRRTDAAKAWAEELERRVDERTEQLRRLAADLEAAEERERRQLARDLHDDLGQTLAAARIRLSALCADAREDVNRPAREIAGLVERADQATRSLAAQLAPAVLYELGLTPALEWLAEDMARTFGLAVHVADDGRAKPLSQEARSILYRAVRELLVNVAKHARTDTAAVELDREGDDIVVRVADEGVGFDPGLIEAPPRRGLGLVSVRERLSFIGGRATLRAVPGDGTEVVLYAPLAAPTVAVEVS